MLRHRGVRCNANEFKSTSKWNHWFLIIVISLNSSSGLQMAGTHFAWCVHKNYLSIINWNKTVFFCIRFHGPTKLQLCNSIPLKVIGIHCFNWFNYDLCINWNVMRKIFGRLQTVFFRNLLVYKLVHKRN